MDLTRWKNWHWELLCFSWLDVFTVPWLANEIFDILPRCVWSSGYKQRNYHSFRLDAYHSTNFCIIYVSLFRWKREDFQLILDKDLFTNCNVRNIHLLLDWCHDINSGLTYVLYTVGDRKPWYMWIEKPILFCSGLRFLVCMDTYMDCL